MAITIRINVSPKLANFNPRDYRSFNHCKSSSQRVSCLFSSTHSPRSSSFSSSSFAPCYDAAASVSPDPVNKNDREVTPVHTLPRPCVRARITLLALLDLDRVKDKEHTRITPLHRKSVDIRGVLIPRILLHRRTCMDATHRLMVDSMDGRIRMAEVQGQGQEDNSTRLGSIRLSGMDRIMGGNRRMGGEAGW